MKYTVENICNQFAISRQGCYKARKQKEKIEDEQHKLIEKVLELRAQMPMLGYRKLYHLLRKEIDSLLKPFGRDKFFELLKNNGLLIKPKRYRPRTTESRHRFKKYDNLIKDLEINRINQVHVSDITYLRTVDRFCYLFLITDLYSRRIMGEQLSESLAIEGSLSALRMAAGKVKNLNGSIHHSDRGIQYCSNIYTEKLKSLGIKISMSEQANPYENAVAERVNGILKQEFMLDKTFPDIMTARKAVKEAIRIYNEKRPHMSLGYKTPEQVYKAQNELSTY
ncbi:MAG: IS3 family transposase [Ignavibacteriaceae bacterium]